MSRAVSLMLASFLAVSSAVLAAQRSPTPSQPKSARRATEAAKIPKLGDEVPQAMLKRALAAHPCDTGEGRQEPCAAVIAGRNRILVAWDATTQRVTYLYSATLAVDSDIRAGDLLEIDPDSPVTPFPGGGVAHRFVSVDWCDTAAELTRDAQWCAVMVPVRPRSGKVLGFVQSLYLNLDDSAAYLDRIAWRLR